MAARNYGQYSGLVSALELVGERWALLIVRDLLVGPRRYSDLQLGLPRIPTNILSTRLKELQAAGVIRRLPLPRGLAYGLTDYGKQLEEVVLALDRWGSQALGEPSESDTVTSDSMTTTFRAAYRTEAAGSLPATTYEAHINDIVLTLRVAPEGLTVTPGPAATPPDLAFTASLGIHSVIAGETPPAMALATGVVHVLSGEVDLLDRFVATFHLAATAGPISGERPLGRVV
ncbi:MAG: helix-turn-helix domain-containing protein [Microbacteriaceae bacterium]